MATISRGAKAAGGTDFTANTDALAAEVNTDFNTIYNDYNGNITNANVATGASIDPTKFDDASNTQDAQATVLDPTTAFPAARPTNLQQELRQLRFAIRKIGVGNNTDITNALGPTNGLARWFDDPVRPGTNLVRNGAFVFRNSSDLPDGWSAVLSPTLTVLTTAYALSRGDTLVVTTSGTADGISHTLSGLKSNTKYIVGADVNVTQGTMTFSTTGADTDAQDFTNISETATVGAQTIAGIVQTDAASPPSDVVMSFVSSSVAGDSFRISNAFCYECAEKPLPRPGYSAVRVSSTAADAARIDSTAYATIQDDTTAADLQVVVRVPAPGMTLRVRGTASLLANGAVLAVDVRLRRDSTTVDSCQKDMASGDIQQFEVHDLFVNPVAGTQYTYTMEGRSEAADLSVNGATEVTGGVPQSVLEVELIPS
jgi:hypothetical protein